MQNTQRCWETDGTLEVQRQPNLRQKRKKVAPDSVFAERLSFSQMTDYGCYVWVTSRGSIVVAVFAYVLQEQKIGN